jgi:hypothetical protein
MPRDDKDRFVSDDQWPSENERRDGVRIIGHPTEEGAYVLLTKSGASTEHCPCCGRTIKTKRGARLVADIVYPLPVS